MLIRLLLLFTVVPIVEVTILIRIGRHIGALPTILMVLGIGMVGAWLARREGFRALGRIRQDLSEGRLPGDAALDAVLILVAGVLMITPGLLTDVAGLLLLVPPVRAAVRRWLRARFQARFTVTHFRPGPGGFRSREDDLIDVEARPHDEP